MMNSKLVGSALFAVGLKVLSNADSDNRNHILAGIVTTGLGIYTVGRANGFDEGYSLGQRSAYILREALKEIE